MKYLFNLKSHSRRTTLKCTRLRFTVSSALYYKQVFTSKATSVSVSTIVKKQKEQSRYTQLLGKIPKKQRSFLTLLLLMCEVTESSEDTEVFHHFVSHKGKQRHFL